MTTTKEVSENIAARNELAERTGPFYDMPGLIGWLGIEKDEILRRVDSSEILAVVTADGVTLFPVWQFNADGTVTHDLMDVIKILNKGIHKLGDTSGWTVALWLNSNFSGLLDPTAPQEKAENAPMYQHLQNGILVSEIKELADSDASCWGAP